MKKIEVNVDNVKECWKYYEEYMEEYRKTHYSDDVNYEDFVDWCEEELMECPCCGEVLLKDDQAQLINPRNSDGVCDGCIECGGYYE